VNVLPVDRFGIVDPDDVRKAVTPENDPHHLMHANNEVGTMSRSRRFPPSPGGPAFLPHGRCAERGEDLCRR